MALNHSEILELRRVLRDSFNNNQPAFAYSVSSRGVAIRDQGLNYDPSGKIVNAPPSDLEARKSRIIGMVTGVAHKALGRQLRAEETTYEYVGMAKPRTNRKPDGQKGR
jgi:hypothetical protein